MGFACFKIARFQAYIAKRRATSLLAESIGLDVRQDAHDQVPRQEISIHGLTNRTIITEINTYFTCALSNP